MKISKTRMLFLAILSTFVFMMANAQTCDWTVKNRTDCDAQIAIVEDCNGIVNVGAMTVLANGTWQNSTSTTITSQPCNTNCTIKVKLESSNNPAAIYSNGDVFCCNLPEDCTPNNCVKIKINTTTKTIDLVKPDGCP